MLPRNRAGDFSGTFPSSSTLCLVSLHSLGASGLKPAFQNPLQSQRSIFLFILLSRNTYLILYSYRISRERWAQIKVQAVRTGRALIARTNSTKYVFCLDGETIDSSGTLSLTPVQSILLKATAEPSSTIEHLNQRRIKLVQYMGPKVITVPDMQ